MVPGNDSNTPPQARNDSRKFLDFVDERFISIVGHCGTCSS